METHLLAEHQEHKCSLRLQPCRWCGVKLPAQSKDEHEDYCGAKTVVLSVNGLYVA